jgi:hypothetical protein
MTITITDGHISTRLFEKALNLYLYLPPTSAHPPGVLNGLIVGMIMRIFRLTTDKTQVTSDIQEFFNRLVARGYTAHQIAPLFHKCYARFRSGSLEAKSKLPDTDAMKKSVFLHIPFHPLNPPSKVVQDLFNKYLYDHRWEDKDATLLHDIKNHAGAPIGINRLIVANHRPQNLGNLLSPRKFDCTPGPPASAFL